MKTDGIWQFLLLFAAGLILFTNSSFIERVKPIVLTSSTVSTSINQNMTTIAVDTVIIKNMTFTPSELQVHKGDIVIWINKDIVAHNVTDYPGNKWTSGTLARGSSWKKTIGGTFDYFCSIHPSMKGKIIVDP